MRARVVVFVALVLVLLAFLFFKGGGTIDEIRIGAWVGGKAEEAAPAAEAENAQVAETAAAAPTVAVEAPVVAATRSGRVLELRAVVKGSWEGISGANVRVSSSDRPMVNPGDKMLVTGAGGVVSVPLAESDPAKFVLEVYREGFSGWWSQWDVAKGEKIPAQHTVELERAALIGGFVVNESNRPVEGATVRVGRVWRGGESIDRSNQRAEVRSVSVKTDAAGRWSNDQVPENLLEHVRIGISHPDYAEGSKMVDAEIVPELRAQTWIATLKQGEKVAGFILDTNRNPVAGAEVAFGARYSSSRNQTKSDGSGHYELKNLNLSSFARDNVVVAMAKGFAPVTQGMSNKTAQGELNFVLAPGAVIRGRVVNREGEPLKGVRVSRERMSIMDDDGIEWSATTDGEGRFEWDGAPAQPQKFYFGTAGYAQVRGKVLQATGKEEVIVLDRKRVLKGTVKNAASGEAVEKFYVLPATGTPERLSSYALSSEREFKGGVFELELDEVEYTVVRLRASGFLTEIFKIPAEGAALDVKLTASGWLEGVVVNASGFPVARAEVAAVGRDTQGMAPLGKGRFTPGRVTADHTVTDETGRFTLDLSARVESVIGVHPEGGFAETRVEDFQRAKELRLQPWGRLEGVLISNGKPARNEKLALHNIAPGPARSGFNTDLGVFEVVTDENGRFAFEMVPSLELTLSRMIRIDERSSRFGERTNILVAPGESRVIEFLAE